MARCPKLDYESRNAIFTSSDVFICTVTGVEMDYDSPKVKNCCKVEYGEEYYNCPIYKNS